MWEGQKASVYAVCFCWQVPFRRPWGKSRGARNTHARQMKADMGTLNLKILIRAAPATLKGRECLVPHIWPSFGQMRDASALLSEPLPFLFPLFRASMDGLCLSFAGRMRGLRTHRGTAPAPGHGARLCRPWIAPHVQEWDEASHFPLETIRQLGKLGLMGSIFPDEYGGSGLGYIEYVLAIEELSRVDGSVGIIVAAHTSLCSNHIYFAGNEQQKRRYLPRLATGEHIGAWALTEPNSGSDAGSARCTAVRKGGSLGAQRHQDLHHQRLLCRCRRGGRCDR